MHLGCQLIVDYSAGSSYIPNDTCLGGEGLKPNMILLTGPNMGGKSTLLRQVRL